jgi:hypothetical protein
MDSFDLIPVPPDDYSQTEKDVELYEKGRALRPVVGTEAWNILLDTLKAYKDKTEEELWALPIGDPNIPTAFAAASALRQQFTFFQEDVQRAVNFAANPTQEVTDYIYGVLRQSDVMRAMGV